MRTIILILSLILSLHQTAWTKNGRTPAYAKNGMVVSTSKIASEVGRDILKQGGNAIDAAIATAFALAVTWPPAGNIGGGGFLVFHNAEGDVFTIDFREKAPLASTKEMYLGKDGKVYRNANHDSLLAVGVPGTVAGLYKAHKKWGSLAWDKLLMPAIDLAEKGIPLPWELFNDVNGRLAPHFKKQPYTQNLFVNEHGEAIQPGELWAQKDLANTLMRIKNHGADGFYKGETAQQFAKFMQQNGGIITTEDLAQYEAVVRTPIHGTYRGYDIYSMPPPSSGGVAIVQMLNMLEGKKLEGMGHNSANYLHTLTEVMRRAFADRAQYIGDPDFTDVPVNKLISKPYARVLASSIHPYKASISDSSKFNQSFDEHSTTHFSVMDKAGNAVSLTYTLEYNWGVKVAVKGLGFFLNNEMGDFNAIPGRTDSKGRIGTAPNLIEPQKRMLSSMSPTIVSKDGKAVLVIGSPGGRTIINTTLQVILNVIDFKMNIGKAIEVGRIHHQWLPNITRAEKYYISPDTKFLYERYGHKMQLRDRRQGRAMGILKDIETGVLSGTADSRSSEGAAVGY